MNKKLTLIICGILVLTGLAFWYFNTMPDKKDASGPLRVGVITWIGNGIFYVAQDKGYWREEGLSVELVPLEDFAVTKQLMASRRIDGYIATTDTVQLLHHEGIDVKAIFVTDISTGGDGIVAIEEIKTIHDLKGKKVAYEPATPSHFLLAYLLDQNGLTPGDLTSVNQTSPDAGASFVAGKVDAAVTWEPWISKANERTGGHVLASTQTLPPIIADLPLFHTETVQQRRNDLKAFMRGIFKAMTFAEKNHDEAVSIIARSFNLTPEEVGEQLPTMRWTNYDDNLKYFNLGPESIPMYIDKAGELWLKLEIIQKKVDAKDVVDASLLKELY